ncbi:MAG: ferrous iron transport protein B [Catalinimonas sp.]
MIAQDLRRVALVGNPNAGKTSLFNLLTGLNQQVGNFPGVTVDKKTGAMRWQPGVRATLIDLPGTYSLYPKSPDERIVLDVLTRPDGPDYPDVVVMVADLTNLKRHLLLFSQLYDLALPVVLAINMIDVAERIGVGVNAAHLARRLGVPVVFVNGRTGQGLSQLREAVREARPADQKPFFNARTEVPEAVAAVRNHFDLQNDYLAYLYLHHGGTSIPLGDTASAFLAEQRRAAGFQSTTQQAHETVARYRAIDELLSGAMSGGPVPEGEAFSEKVDGVLTHPVWGYALFFGALLLIFQALFAWATYPMDLIDGGIARLNEGLRGALPAGPLVDLLTDGMIAGVGGVLIFVPQIALLFFFIAVLEETGYMARVVFLMDRIMRRFGLNGRSVVPLVSGWACAIPAVMSARTIQNRKERLITIFVTPLMSCSARLPVYTVLVALVVPSQRVLGVLNLQGLLLLGLYALGFVAAVGSAWGMKQLLRSRERSHLVMELPDYRMPRWRNVLLTVWEKVRVFVWEAGKVIVAISILLWGLASFGPGGAMNDAEAEVRATWQSNAPAAHGYTTQGQRVGERTEVATSAPTLDDAVAASRLEASYAGHLGRFIEPAIRPLGFDWKIGIALVTSFAAREVFVGTMSTLYSIGASDNEGQTIRQRLRAERNPATGGPRFTPAVALSLLLFYVFAMQCMSTLAVVRQETRSWWWPLLQLVWMTGLAYGASLLAYQVLS